MGVWEYRQGRLEVAMPNVRPEKVDLSALAQIGRHELVVVRLWDHWDGLMSGLAEYRGRDVWVQAFGDDAWDDAADERRYLVYALSDDEARAFREAADEIDRLREERQTAGPDTPERRAAEDAWRLAVDGWEKRALETNIPIGWVRGSPGRAAGAWDVGR